MKLIQPGETFQNHAVRVVHREAGAEFLIIAGIHAMRVCAQTHRAALRDQEGSSLGAEARPVQHAIRVFADERRRIAPLVLPAGEQDHHAARRDRAVFSFPRRHIIHRQAVVGVLRRLLADIDHHRRHD